MVKERFPTLIAEPPSTLRTCLIVLAMVCTWSLGGAYLWQHPPAAVAEAVVQVPPGTDPENLCNNPEIIKAALDKLSELKRFPNTGVKGEGGDRTSPSQLSGTLSGRKAIDGSWKLSYQAPNAEIAVNELTALVTELERHLAQPKNKQAVMDRRQLDDRLQQLKLRKSEILKTAALQNQDLTDPERELNAESMSEQGGAEPALELAATQDPAVVKERINALQRAATEARLERMRAEEELSLVGTEITAGKKLESVANQLSAGPIQDAVRQVDRQARLSIELRQVNTTLSNDSEIYGEKHPRLIELRRRFDRLLQDVGGWEHLLADSAVREHLTESLEQVLEVRREREVDLQVQLELEQSELQDQAEVVLTRSRTSGTLKKVAAEIAENHQALASLDKQLKSESVVARGPAVVVASTLIERGWPWLVVVFAGIFLGWGTAQIPRFERQPQYEIPMEVPLLTVPRVLLPSRAVETAAPAVPVASVSFSSVAATETLDLAQRRAARQARWQQTYA
jgi:hypothetical protein